MFHTVIPDLESCAHPEIFSSHTITSTKAQEWNNLWFPQLLCRLLLGLINFCSIRTSAGLALRDDCGISWANRGGCLHTQTQGKAFNPSLEGNAHSSPAVTSLIKQVDGAGKTNRNPNKLPKKQNQKPTKKHKRKNHQNPPKKPKLPPAQKPKED